MSVEDEYYEEEFDQEVPSQQKKSQMQKNESLQEQSYEDNDYEQDFSEMQNDSQANKEDKSKETEQEKHMTDNYEYDDDDYENDFEQNDNNNNSNDNVKNQNKLENGKEKSILKFQSKSIDAKEQDRSKGGHSKHYKDYAQYSLNISFLSLGQNQQQNQQKEIHEKIANLEEFYYSHHQKEQQQFYEKMFEKREQEVPKKYKYSPYSSDWSQHVLKDRFQVFMKKGNMNIKTGVHDWKIQYGTPQQRQLYSKNTQLPHLNIQKPLQQMNNISQITNERMKEFSNSEVDLNNKYRAPVLSQQVNINNATKFPIIKNYSNYKTIDNKRAANNGQNGNKFNKKGRSITTQTVQKKGNSEQHFQKSPNQNNDQSKNFRSTLAFKTHNSNKPQNLSVQKGGSSSPVKISQPLSDKQIQNNIINTLTQQVPSEPSHYDSHQEQEITQQENLEYEEQIEDNNKSLSDGLQQNSKKKEKVGEEEEEELEYEEQFEEENVQMQEEEEFLEEEII